MKIKKSGSMSGRIAIVLAVVLARGVLHGAHESRNVAAIDP